MLYHKLTGLELERLSGLVSVEDIARITAASLARTPGEFAEEVVKVPLNKARSVEVRSIHFYGGENFGNPLAFVAEVVNLTTNSAFSRFINANHLQWLRTRIPFTY